MYWVYQNDNWYAGSWYNGPWWLVAPQDVPVYILRVPVGYYRQPPGFFGGWQRDAPPRWGEHWGGEWEHRRAGWERWDHSSAPAPAPLPVYQRQYSGDRYPRVEQQPALQVQNDRYQPHDRDVRKQYDAQQGRRAPAAATQARPQARDSSPQGMQRPPASVQQTAPMASHAPAPQRPGENAQRSTLTSSPPQTKGPPVQQPRQAVVQRQQPTPTSRVQEAGPQGKGASSEAKRGQEPRPYAQQAAAQPQQPAAASRSEGARLAGSAAPQEARRAQESGQDRDHEKADDRGQERR